MTDISLKPMHYEHAPITEALIDIRVEFSRPFDIDQLQPMKNRLGDRYPRIQPRTLAQAQIVFGSESKAEATNTPWGLQFFSGDDKEVFQAHMQGFTFSRLEPYQTWERLRDEAKHVWGIYKNVVKPTKVTRVAVRYLNQFHFPGANIEPEDYLYTFPQLSTHLSNDLRYFDAFLMSLRIPQPDIGGTMVINESVPNEPKKDDTVSIILDLDLFVENPKVTDDQSIWDLLEHLRKRKNLYFEACITDKTRELIR